MSHNAIGMYIFGGSQTIGHIQTGWNVEKVLEMTDDMPKNNAYHFIKNYGNKCPVIIPSIWNKPEYLAELKKKDYDLLFANNPCSGLSRECSPNTKSLMKRDEKHNDLAVNSRFYEVVDVISTIKPKMFLMENAPALVTENGKIVRTNLVNTLNSEYRILFIRDSACNHNTPMLRQRTLICGFRKNIFKSIPVINSLKQPRITSLNFLNEIKARNEKSPLPNMEPIKSHKLKSLHDNIPDFIIANTDAGHTWIESLALKNVDQIEPYKSFIAKLQNQFKNNIRLLKNGKKVYDRSSFRTKPDSLFRSMTSAACFIHPIENRELYVREYAGIMGYPDDFIFYETETKTPIIQCLSQGVPVNFIKYISSELMRVFDNQNRSYIFESNGPVDIAFQNNCLNKRYKFDLKTFNSINNLVKLDKSITCEKAN